MDIESGNEVSARLARQQGAGYDTTVSLSADGGHALTRSWHHRGHQELFVREELGGFRVVLSNQAVLGQEPTLRAGELHIDLSDALHEFIDELSAELHRELSLLLDDEDV